MEFKKLKIKNFLAVGEKEVEIDFTKHGGLNLIKGRNLDVSDVASNGSGKSVIIDAVIFALTGKTLRRLKKEEYYIHRKAKSDCFVELEFDNVKICRRFILDKKGKKKETRIDFLVDGVPRGTNASAVKTAEEIDSYLGINFDTLCNILVFGQHNSMSFLDATEQEKRDIVENLTNLKEWNKLEETARIKLRENKTKYKICTETYNAQDNLLQDHRQLIKEQEKKQSEYNKSIQQEIEILTNRINNIPNLDDIQKQWKLYNDNENKKSILLAELSVEQTNMANINEEIANLQNQIQEENNKKQPLLDRIYSLKNAKTEMLAKLAAAQKQYCEPILEEIKQNHQNIAKLQTESNQKINSILPKSNWDAEINSLHKDLSKIQQEIDAIKNKKLIQGMVCPECFGSIDLSNCQHILNKKEQELSVKQNEINEHVNAKNKDLEDIKVQTQKISTEYENKIKLIEYKNAELQAQADSIKQQLQDRFNKAQAEIEQELNKLSEDIDIFNDSIKNKFKPLLDRAKTHRENTVQRINNINSQIELLFVSKPTVTIEEVGRKQVEQQTLKQQIKDKQKQIKENPYLDIINSLKRKEKELLDNLNITLQDIKDTEELMPYYEILQTLFGKEGIKSFIIKQIIPTLNQQIDFWMQILYQGSIKVIFDDLLDVKLFNNASQNEMIFGQGSGGEKRRIDLAVMLAFRQIMKLSTNKDPNIIFLDEIAENIDMEGIVRVNDMLLEMAKSNNVYVITHNPTLLSMMDSANVINVQKHNGSMIIDT